ncbi:MAG: PAS domain S-box protein [Myxacorys californica WJT36-NPBG1]|jgi:PAS domain S-box-containing protein|nr:PAS domain S-box protein [Myxacorys californica WJT36-NPBG1]
MQEKSPVSQAERSFSSNAQPASLSSGKAGMVLQSADGTIQACDVAAEQLLGYSSEQIIGQISLHALGRTICPDGSPFAIDQLGMIAGRNFNGTAAPRQPGQNAVIGFYRADGTLVWLQLDSNPLFQNNATTPYAVVTTLRAITPARLDGSSKGGSNLDRPQAEADLDRVEAKLDRLNQVLNHNMTSLAVQLGQAQRLSHQRLAEIEAIYATAPIGLYFVDTDFRYVRVNELLAEINGTPASEHIGRTFREVLPELADSIEPLFRHVIETGEPILDLEVVGTNCAQPGVERVWLSSYYPFVEDGRVLGINGVVQEITDRKRVEQALQDTETRLTRFVDSDLIGISFGDIYGGVKYANDEFLRIIGYSRQEFESGQVKWTDITPSEWLQVDQQSIAEAQAHKACTPHEKEYIRKDGSRVWVLIGFTLIGEAQEEYVAFVLDISDRKRSEEALRQSEQNFRALADSMPNMFWTARPDGWLEYYNQRWFDYTGLTLEQSQGWGWEPVLHPDDLPRCIDLCNESIRTGKDYQIEYRFRRASDGQYRWFLGRAFPLRDENGQIIRWYGSCTDIHDQKCAVEERDRYAEQSLRALAQEQTIRQEAERANQLKDEFLAVLSHELRTPLNPILGWAKLLQSGRLSPEKTQDAVTTIERNAKLQSQLVEDLLDMSRIMRGKLTLNQFPINLGFVISAALETIRLAADAKAIRLNVTLDPNVRSILGDAGRLQQVFWNLLSNAIKFTPERGQIDVTLTEVGNQARVQVKDTGVGIDAEFLPHVFEYFRQEDGSTTRKFGGLGLGLAIARQLVELHSGRIWAESLGDNQGATFTVEIPLLKTEKTEPTREAAESSRRPSPLAGLHALVVDDDFDARDIVAFLLQDAGAIVQVADSASEALSILERFNPDILLSDIAMPEEDGYGLIETIRATGRTLPAIALTAYASEVDQERAIAAGFQHHISKPIDPDQVVAIVLDLVRDSM